MTTESLLTAGSENTDAAPTTTADTTTATDPSATGEASATTAPDATKAADGTKAAGEPGSTAKVDEGAPEKYADFKAPEGTEALAPELVTEVSALAKELNLSQDKAQKVIDTATKLAAKGVEAQTAAITSVRADWVSQVKADKEITAGPGLDANLATAKAAMLATTNPQFQMLMARSGLGDHPDVIRHFLKIAPAFAEDKHVPGGKQPPGDGKSAEKVLYPNNP